MFFFFFVLFLINFFTVPKNNIAKHKFKHKVTQISSLIEKFWFSQKQTFYHILVFDVDFQSEFHPSLSISDITKFTFDLGIFCAWSIPHLLHITNLLEAAGYKVSQILLILKTEKEF